MTRAVVFCVLSFDSCALVLSLCYYVRTFWWEEGGFCAKADDDWERSGGGSGLCIYNDLAFLEIYTLLFLVLINLCVHKRVSVRLSCISSHLLDLVKHVVQT